MVVFEGPYSNLVLIRNKFQTYPKINTILLSSPRGPFAKVEAHIRGPDTIVYNETALIEPSTIDL